MKRPGLSISWLALALSAPLGAQAETPPATEPAAATGASAPQAPSAEPAPPRADLSEANAAVLAQDYARADEVLRPLVEAFPDDPAALLMRGEVLLALGKPVQARPLLERAVGLDPRRERAHFQLASVLQAVGELEPAAEHFEREAELNEDPDVKVMAQLNRSILFEKLGRLDRSAAALEAVLALDPDRPAIYGDLATLYLESGELDRAAATLERGTEEGGFASAKHYYVLGTRYYQDGAYAQAAEAFKEALNLQDEYAEAERSLGAALDQLGREAEAVKHLERYLELRPDAPDADPIRRRIEAAD